MKCHYEVLGVERDSCDEDIKRAYRKLALKWHPDKNPDNPTVANEQFLTIQQAYDVLSDSHERAWYDNHREAILKGGLGEDYRDDSIDLFKYFTTNCYRGYGDDEKGFYAVYRGVFETLVAEDSEFAKNDGSESEDDDEDKNPPNFGDSESPYESKVHKFYAYWQSYSTSRTFAWLDPYDVRDAPNRRVSRLIEKENKKVRERARRERNEQVRNLVGFVRKRDKRVQANALRMAERARENARKAEDLKRAKLLERQEELRKHRISDWSRFSNIESELRSIEADLVVEFGEILSDEEESGGEALGSSALYCVACNKIFKTQSAFVNHEKSKKHRDKLFSLRRTMENEEFGEATSSGATGPEMEDFFLETTKNDDKVDDEGSEEELHSNEDEDSEETTGNGDFRGNKDKMSLGKNFKVKGRGSEAGLDGGGAMGPEMPDFLLEPAEKIAETDDETSEDELHSEPDEDYEEKTGGNVTRGKKGKVTLGEIFKVRGNVEDGESRESTRKSDSKGKKGKMTLKDHFKVKIGSDDEDTRKSTKRTDSKGKKDQTTLNDNFKVKEELDDEDVEKFTKKTDFPSEKGQTTLSEDFKVEEDEDNEESSPEEIISDEKEEEDDDEDTTRSARRKRKKDKTIRKVIEEQADSEEESFINTDLGLSKKQRKKRRNLEETLGRRERVETTNDSKSKDQETRTNDEQPAIIVEAEGNPVGKTTRGKRAKEVRKAQKLVAKNEAAKSQRGKREARKNSDPQDIEHRCVTCKVEFASKNKLFDHLKKTGHSVYLPSGNRTKKNNEKKPKGRPRSESDSS